MDDKQSRVLHGNVFIDFSNNTSTDETALSYFQNLATLFKLAKDDLHLIETAFPNMTNFQEYVGDLGLELIKLTARKIQIESYIFEPNILIYDVENKHFQGKGTDFIFSIDEIRNHLKELRELDECFKNKNPYDCADIKLSELDELVNMGQRIATLKRQLPRYSEIIRMPKYYLSMMREHNIILKNKEKLCSLLDEITHSNISESKILPSYIEMFNKKRFIKMSILNDGLKDTFDITPFTQKQERNPGEIYSDPIIYCVVKFLKNPANLEYIKKCDHCKNYYLASKRNPNQKYCSICSKINKWTDEQMATYMRETYRPTIKKNKEIIKRKKEIERLMNRGLSRKDAEYFA